MANVTVLPKKREDSPLWSGLTALVIGLSLIAVSLACLAAILLPKRNIPRVHRAVEKRRDETLKETFPASDSPASQYFDIPANRM